MIRDCGEAGDALRVTDPDEPEIRRLRDVGALPVGAPVGTCQPYSTITEAIPWSGKGPVRISLRGADQQRTYDVGTTPVTITSATSGWRW